MPHSVETPLIVPEQALPQSAWAYVDQLRAASLKMPAMLGFKTRYRPLTCPFDWVLAHIPCGASLFDVGCGAGALLYLATQYRSVVCAHGYDVIEAAGCLTDYYGLEAQVLQGEVRSVDDPLPDLLGYNTVTMIDVLHHIPADTQQGFLKGLYEAMSSGATLILKDIDASATWGAWLNQLHDWVFSGETVALQSRMQCEALLTQLGFVVDVVETRWSLWYPHFMVVAKKPA